MDGGASLAKADAIAPGRWLALARSARLVAKDPRTGRESTLRGPARVRACVGAQEEWWVAGGTFESSPGAGESPGAEEWVVTPAGVVRFGSAQLGVDVGARGVVSVVVGQGAAFVWAAPDAFLRDDDGDGGVRVTTIDEGWVRVAAPGSTLRTRSVGSALDAARSAVDACVAGAHRAQGLGRALLAGDAGGDTAARQVVERRLARAACAVAALRVHLAPASAANLSASLAEADVAWRGVPRTRLGPGARLAEP